jgi:dihydrofolate synthase/folylpolyglutamate synthase
VRRAADRLGAPQGDLRVLHVAGTNGKGSTSAMLESILRESGRRVALYTSPHLSRVAERLRLDGRPIDDAALDDALTKVFRDAPSDLTFFETLTLAAFVAFRDAAPDVVVLEVGLGGRLDATNLVEAPLACGITSIAKGEGGRFLEHEQLLGSTAVAIAREKAGIAKAGRPLSIGPVDPAARDAVVEVAGAAGAGPIWMCRGSTAEAPMPDGTVVALRPALAGPHQIDNAEVAASMAVLARELGASTATIERGIERARWPGRFERIDAGGRTVVLDCAHNVDGARALAATLASEGHRPEKTVLVFGALADKGWEPMLRILAPLARARVYTCPKGRMPASPEALAAIAPGTSVEDPRRAIDRAIDMADSDDTVLVCGSIYLVGEIRAGLLGIEPDPVIAL